jgi:hypothetical protein
MHCVQLISVKIEVFLHRHMHLFTLLQFHLSGNAEALRPDQLLLMYFLGVCVYIQVDLSIHLGLH